MTVQDPLAGWPAQAVRQSGESRPLTWRPCQAIRHILELTASITVENSSMARGHGLPHRQGSRMTGEPARCSPGRTVPDRRLNRACQPDVA